MCEEALNEDNKSDTNLKIFYERLSEVVKNPKNINIIDVFNADER